MKCKAYILLTCLFASGAFISSHAVELAQKVKTKLEIRPRWENAQIEGNSLKTANGLIFRIRVGTELINLASIEGLSLFFEPWVVTAPLKDYSPEKSGYDLIADPVQTRINQVYIGYRSENFKVKVGRQEITFDNHRFIGNVGWRQMAQTYDALRADFKPLHGLDINIVYIGAKTGVTDIKAGEGAPWVFAPHNTFIGEDTPVNDSLLLRANYTFSPLQTDITFYSYLLNGMHDTYGIKLNGKPKFYDRIVFNFWGEVAYQRDPSLTSHENQKQNIEALYYYISVKPSYKTSLGDFFIEVGYEFLEGADEGETRGFTTPLATLHGHNGWADAFLRYTGESNTYGLRDFRVGGGLKNRLIGNISFRYHTFSADKDFPGGGNKFGRELDILYTKELFNNLALGAKAALYDADEDAKNAGVADKNIKKFWLWLTYRWST